MNNGQNAAYLFTQCVGSSFKTNRAKRIIFTLLLCKCMKKQHAIISNRKSQQQNLSMFYLWRFQSWTSKQKASSTSEMCAKWTLRAMFYDGVTTAQLQNSKVRCSHNAYNSNPCGKVHTAQTHCARRRWIQPMNKEIKQKMRWKFVKGINMIEIFFSPASFSEFHVALFGFFL